MVGGCYVSTVDACLGGVDGGRRGCFSWLCSPFVCAAILQENRGSLSVEVTVGEGDVVEEGNKETRTDFERQEMVLFLGGGGKRDPPTD
jgi:hypothetical protein